MRLLLHILFVLGLLAAPSIAADRTKAVDLEVKTAQVGQTVILDFMGNKGAVHRWRLVKDRSKGLNLVEVDEIGWVISSNPDRKKFDPVDTMRFRVVPKAPGTAELTFEHNYRGWRGKYYLKWKTVRILIDPAV